ncbi:MAG TPA: PDZ domain-containing protein [Chloroflexota bacterium]|nr:PDZ domain-containing protein [Chloroflexota bacterium]
MGVPVITAGSEVVVGFDRPRLEQIAARYTQSGSSAAGPKLGLAARTAPGGGVEIGNVRSGSLGSHAGFQVGDVLESLSDQPVNSVGDVERLTRTLKPGQAVKAIVRRHGQRLHLTLTN